MSFCILICLTGLWIFVVPFLTGMVFRMASRGHFMSGVEKVWLGTCGVLRCQASVLIVSKALGSHEEPVVF